MSTKMRFNSIIEINFIAVAKGGSRRTNLEHYARAFSEALGRTIRYRDVPLSAWTETLRKAGVPEHLLKHLVVMTELHKQGRYDRMTDDLVRFDGEAGHRNAGFREASRGRVHPSLKSG